MTTSAPPGEAWAADVEAALSRAGHRRSGARSTVIGFLARQDEPRTAHEIEHALVAEGSGVGRATIYRALDLLVEHGHVKRLDVGDGVARYEAAPAADRFSVRLVCDLCGCLLRFDDREWRAAISRLADRLACDIYGYEMVLHGRCRGCSPQVTCERCR